MRDPLKHEMPCFCRYPLLEFFANSGDFTRRLTGVRANSKFFTPLAGPADYFSVRSTLMTDQ